MDEESKVDVEFAICEEGPHFPSRFPHYGFPATRFPASSHTKAKTFA